MGRRKVMVIYGTRPEAIKVAPLIKQLQASTVVSATTVVTGQHRQILDQVNQLFGITPDHDLDLMRDGQSLNELSARLLNRLDPILDAEKPDAVVVQGDTTSVAVSAIAAFYRQVPVVHLEAGLRSGSIASPYPEEANRRVAGQVAALHLAPTVAARENLIAEGFNPELITITGNTVVDALMYAKEQPVVWQDERLARAVASSAPIVLVTTHRRENWGAPMVRTAKAVATLAQRYPDHVFVAPMHPNPQVRTVLGSALATFKNVLLLDPLEYLQFSHLIARSHLVLTDSGGVQEEAPSLGKPVLVLRENTERPEAVTAGTVKLVGTDTQRIVTEATTLLDDADAYVKMANAVNPYGDGLAAQRSVAAIEQLLGVGVRMPDFVVAA